MDLIAINCHLPSSNEKLRRDLNDVILNKVESLGKKNKEKVILYLGDFNSRSQISKKKTNDSVFKFIQKVRVFQFNELIKNPNEDKEKSI